MSNINSPSNDTNISKIGNINEAKSALLRATGQENSVRRRIMGLPARYTPVADHLRKVYDKTILGDFPILNITPGILKYKNQLNVLVSSIRNIVASDLLPIETDGRRVYFKYAYPEYARYLNILATNVFNKMMNYNNATKTYTTIQHLLELDTTDDEFINDAVYQQEYEKFGGEINLKSLQDLVNSIEARQKAAADSAINASNESGSEQSQIIVNKVGGGGNSSPNSSNIARNSEEAAQSADWIAAENALNLHEEATTEIDNEELYYKTQGKPIESPSIRTYGLSFFVDASSVANDSIDNSYTESEMERNAKALSDSVTEMRFSMGQKNLFGKITDAITRLPELLKGGVGVFTTTGAVSAIMKGAKMTFPKVFEDNNFTRSYSISFKFVSPYGDKFSIFNYVYLPVLSLLCFTLPRQLGINTYIAPFLVKMDYPGNFAIDMGVITRMSIDKVGDSSSWSIDGLPLQLNVTIDVMDLFPVLMMAKSGKLINQSVSMAVYLNNMAGLSLDTDNPIGRFFENRYDRFLTRVAYLKDTPERWTENTKDRINHRIGQIFGLH